MMPSYYRDRSHAGQVLAGKLSRFEGERNLIVLGLPRGGVPVAFEVARALHAPLDVMVVRKLGFPGNEELAMGAVGSGGVRVLNEDVLGLYPVSDDMIQEAVERESKQLAARERRYRGDRAYPDFAGRSVILVDDGLATGSTMRAAVVAVRRRHPERLIVAVPVGAGSTCEELGKHVDEIVCATTPEPFFAVGAWYEDFAQTTDDEVSSLLKRAQRESARAAEGASSEAKHG